MPSRRSTHVHDRPSAIPRLAADAFAGAGLLPGAALEALERRALPLFLPLQRWFGGADDASRSVRIVDQVVLAGGAARWLVLDAAPLGGEAARYLLPVALARGEQAGELLATRPASVLASLRAADGETVLHDGWASGGSLAALLAALADGGAVATQRGSIRWQAFAGGEAVPRLPAGEADVHPVSSEQSNSSARLEERWFVKLYRRLESGAHPEAEVVQRLAEQGFDATPRGLGAFVHCGAEAGFETTLGIVQELAPGARDLWQLTVASRSGGVGLTADLAARLGDVTARMHVALAAPGGAPAFAPEDFRPGDLESRAAALQDDALNTLAGLESARGALDAEHRPAAERLLRRAPELLPRLRRVCQGTWHARAIRCHGDYHLGQVLARDLAGADPRLWIVDFEGEPDRPLAARRRKSVALLDAAGMLRSFHYASCVLGGLAAERSARARALADGFLRSYWNSARAGNFLPDIKDARGTVLGLFCLEKAFYELRYELRHRPDWAWIPLEGLLELLEGATA